MAAITRTKMATLPVGSAEWIQNEREQANQFHEQEVEEFMFSTRNELDWMNEHMTEIFNQDSKNFADIFKTPGKLRGKTPRTARKRDPAAARAPLTDLFAPNPQSTLSPATNTTFYQKVAQFKVAEDADESQRQPPQSAHKAAGTSRRSPLRPANTDSGYHGMTEDEMDVDSQQMKLSQISANDWAHPTAPALATLEETRQSIGRAAANDSDSFVSARDEPAQQPVEDVQIREDDHEDDNATVPDEEMDVDQQDVADSEGGLDGEHNDENADQPEEDANWHSHVDQSPSPEALEDNFGDAKSPSDNSLSSPANALLRKSSLTFASLPAREPLKRSSQLGSLGRSSTLGRQTLLGKSIGDARSHSQETVNDEHADDNLDLNAEAKEYEDEDEDDEEEAEQKQEQTEAAQTYNKSTTQRLHERIGALGQPKKSFPNLSAHAQAQSQTHTAAYPSLPADSHTQQQTVHETDDDDDDWIEPIRKTSRPASGVEAATEDEPRRPATADDAAPMERPVSQQSPVKHHPYLGHKKSASTLTLMSPGKMSSMELHKVATSTSNPNLDHAVGTTTPTASPSGRSFRDGPLSASKSKLYSVLKSAKSIFASSAGASAQAKLDALTASPTRHKTNAPDPDTSRMPGGFGSDIPLAPKPAERAEGRRLRSSTESDKRKDAQKAHASTDKLEKARQAERKKAAEQKKAETEKAAQLERDNLEAMERERQEAASRAESQRSEDAADEEAAPAAPTTKGLLPPGKLRAPGRLARPTKPSAAQAKPAPVSIKVASQSQRMGPIQPAASAAKEPAQSTATTRAASRAESRTGSRAGTRAGSAQPPPVSAARVRALEAAARKKEQDEKAAQRKIEQKRELDRKRAAKAEEERRLEQERKEAEQKRVQEERAAEQKRREEARITAQRQAEARQAEHRRLEQQRAQAQIAAEEKARAAEIAAALEKEKQDKLRAQSQYPRADVGGTLRQLAKADVSRALPHAPKPAKRQMDGAEDEQRPGLQRGPASYQQQPDNKRRKTLEEEEEPHGVRNSVLAPPKRPSNMRKDTYSNLKLPNGYSHAPPPAAHHAQSMYKSTVNAQHQLQHAKAPLHPNDMLKLSNARIPFADAPGPSYASHYVQDGASSSKTTAQAQFKTPGKPASAMMPKSTAKSSPMYQNGDKIELPEIQTDSEDSDSDSDAGGGGPGNGFRQPSWTNSPALRELLTSQQLVDPESVFGPIAPLQMDEVFKNSKNPDRMKRFRDRGSSARWVETGDAVTQEEKKRDREMRAKVVREGGWRYDQQL